MSEELNVLRATEEKLHGIDSQFLTEGLRLVLLLPAFSLLCFWSLGLSRPKPIMVAR